MQPNSKMLIGAVVAAALAFAVYYGLIGQQAANNIQTQANQTLGTGPTMQQQSAQPVPQGQMTQAPAPAGQNAQNPGVAPRP